MTFCSSAKNPLMVSCQVFLTKRLPFLSLPNTSVPRRWRLCCVLLILKLWFMDWSFVNNVSLSRKKRRYKNSKHADLSVISPCHAMCIVECYNCQRNVPFVFTLLVNFKILRPFLHKKKQKTKKQKGKKRKTREPSTFLPACTCRVKQVVRRGE